MARETRSRLHDSSKDIGAESRQRSFAGMSGWLRIASRLLIPTERFTAITLIRPRVRRRVLPLPWCETFSTSTSSRPGRSYRSNQVANVNKVKRAHSIQPGNETFGPDGASSIRIAPRTSVRRAGSLLAWGCPNRLLRPTEITLIRPRVRRRVLPLPWCGTFSTSTSSRPGRSRSRSPVNKVGPHASPAAGPANRRSIRPHWCCIPEGDHRLCSPARILRIGMPRSRTCSSN